MFASALLILLFFSNSNLVFDFPFVSGQSERELLLELRNSLTYNSSISSKLVHWNESVDLCGWAGVECDSWGRVSGLDLSRESISDGINGADSSLFKLSHLQSLSLAQNRFESKEFPSGFGQLTELRYLNLSLSGFSGQIPSDLSNLTRLVVLDLSPNVAYSLNLPNLLRMIHNYTRLRELYLDDVNVSANGNEWGSAISSSLPNLRVLSMSNSLLTCPFHPSLLKLRYLSDIYLDFNNFSSPFPEFFSDFTNLKVLSMRACELSGVIPPKLFQMKSVQRIHLDLNSDLGGSFPEFPVNGSLQRLILFGSKFTGTLPESIGNLGMLSELSVSGCNISGPIPSTIQNLRRLVVLNLSLNRFSGPVPSFALLKNLTKIDLSFNGLTGQIPYSLWKGLDNLVSLYLRENSLEGEIPLSLFHLPSLQVLVLNKNSFSGFSQVSTNASSPLQSLFLNDNKLEGSIPRIFFELRSLERLSMSGNKFSGPLELTDFHKLANLSLLNLSYNNLFVHVNEEASLTSLLPQLSKLYLASCKLQKLPNFRNHSSLYFLDLSGNELDGPIPNWMWEINNGSLFSFNLSHNRFSHLQEPYNLPDTYYLDLHDNMLIGQIPIPLSSAEVLDFSRNEFSSLPSIDYRSLSYTAFFSAAHNEIMGTIPPSFCNASYLEVLNLSNNRFNGRVPSCLANDALKVLKLRGNNLDGYIPDTFPVGCGLKTLDLSWNSLQGKLPKSLTRCSELEVLDLTNNTLSDALPCWLNTLSRLRILVLRSNMFHGNISCLGSWQSLQILDFAYNNITGVIPAKMFRDLQGFMIDVTQKQSEVLQLLIAGVYYQDSVTVIMKNSELHLDKILRYHTSIDFSCNHLQGVIPEAIGELKSLYALNFSHNDLSGHIPSRIGNLKQLGSLDLSSNALSREIPQQLADLTSLSVLNLSHNQLVGMIPEGSQFRTFTAASFEGNARLCGFPLEVSCKHKVGDLSPPMPQNEQLSLMERIEWGYVFAALGYVVGLGCTAWVLLFCRRWREIYFEHVDRLFSRLFPQRRRRSS